AVAHDICARVAYRGDALEVAADAVVMGVIPAHGGDGGVIALDGSGNITMPFNTPGMYRGWVGPDGSRGTAIFGPGADEPGRPAHSSAAPAEAGAAVPGAAGSVPADVAK